MKVELQNGDRTACRYNEILNAITLKNASYRL